MGRLLRLYKSPVLVLAAGVAGLLIATPALAPDVIAGDDTDNTVTITTIVPHVNKCKLKATGPNNLINLEANTTLSTNDNNRTNTQIRPNRVAQGSGSSGDGATLGQNNSLYFLVNISASIASDGTTGGTDDIVNVTVQGWFEDPGVAGSGGPGGYNTTAGKNTNFRLNFTTNSKSMGGTTNASTVTWPVGTTLDVSGRAETRITHLGIADNTVRRQNATQMEIAIPVEFGPNIRWGRNATGLINNSDPLADDTDDWNFRCFVQMDADPATGLQTGVYNQESTDVSDRGEFSVFKYASLSVAGNPSSAFAPGAPESGFSCNGVASQCQQIDYKSNAPFNLSVNISNLRISSVPVTCVSGAGCLNAQTVGIDVGQMTETLNTAPRHCGGSNECYRFYWDNASTGTRSMDGHLWVRGANGTGILEQDAATRWTNLTCGSEEFASLAGSTCSDAEDQEAAWFAQIPLGTIEGTYTAVISYRLKTHANPSPRSNAET